MCNVCHGAPNSGWLRCYSCNQTVGQVSRPITRVLPISLTTKDGQFYHVLKSYKNWGGTQENRLQMAALYARFIDEHGGHIRADAGADWNVVTIVPSSGERHGPHPLENVIKITPNLGKQYQPLLGKGTEKIENREATDNGYQPITDVHGMRVLLIDDTFTRGAHVQSAASALQIGGGQVIAAVVAGRIMNPGYGTAQALLDKQRAKGFAFDKCGLCADP